MGLVYAADGTLSIQAQIKHALAANAIRVLDLFREWDGNGDGVVSTDEFLRAMPLLGIHAGKEEVVYEFRQNGVLRMIRVVPNWGKPYYLVPQDPTRGNGDLEQAGALVPSWTLRQFEPKKP